MLAAVVLCSSSLPLSQYPDKSETVRQSLDKEIDNHIVKKEKGSKEIEIRKWHSHMLQKRSQSLLRRYGQLGTEDFPVCNGSLTKFIFSCFLSTSASFGQCSP